MIALLTTSRKALAGAGVALVSPLAALYASGVEITSHTFVAAALMGVIGGLGVWALPNTDEYVAAGKHAAGE